MFDAGVSLGLTTHVKIDDRFPRSDHLLVEGSDQGRDLRQHLPDAAADVLRRGHAIDGGKPIVDADVTELSIDEQEADWGSSIYILQLCELTFDVAGGIHGLRYLL